MVVLRLRRGGKTHDPHYRIVAQERRSKLNGAYIESIGHYHPTQSKDTLVIDQDRAKHWLSFGAVPSETVNNLFVREGILPKKAHVKRTKVMPKDKTPAAEPAAEEPAAEEPAAEESKEEVKEEQAVEEPTTEEPTKEEPAKEPAKSEPEEK